MIFYEYSTLTIFKIYYYRGIKRFFHQFTQFQIDRTLYNEMLRL